MIKTVAVEVKNRNAQGLAPVNHIGIPFIGENTGNGNSRLSVKITYNIFDVRPGAACKKDKLFHLFTNLKGELRHPYGTAKTLLKVLKIIEDTMTTELSSQQIFVVLK